MRVVGGRAVHPINVRVGGFYRAPRAAELAPGAPRRLRAHAGGAGRGGGLGGGARLPRLRARRRAGLPARRRASTRSTAGGWCRAAASRSAPASSTTTSSRSTSSTRPRCTRGMRDGGTYLVGPLARYELNSAQLSPVAPEAAPRRRARRRLPQPVPQHRRARWWRCCTPLDEALRLIDAYEPPDPPGVEIEPRAGGGLRLDRGAARHALAPLRARRRRPHRRGPDRPADLAEPGDDRGGPARLRAGAPRRCRQRSSDCAASRRSATTTPASPARPTSCASMSTAPSRPARRDRRRQPDARRRRGRSAGRSRASASRRPGRVRCRRARGRADRAARPLGRRARWRWSSTRSPAPRDAGAIHSLRRVPRPGRPRPPRTGPARLAVVAIDRARAGVGRTPAWLGARAGGRRVERGDTLTPRSRTDDPCARTVATGPPNAREVGDGGIAAALGSVRRLPSDEARATTRSRVGVIDAAPAGTRCDRLVHAGE